MKHLIAAVLGLMLLGAAANALDGTDPLLKVDRNLQRGPQLRRPGQDGG